MLWISPQGETQSIVLVASFLAWVENSLCKALNDKDAQTDILPV